MSKFITKTFKFEVKNFDAEARTVEGLAAVFGNYDMNGDKFFPGVFTKSIQELGPAGKDRIVLLAQHDKEKPIGRILELTEVPEGLYVKAYLGTHRDGDDYYRMAQEGIMNEFSVGYKTINKIPNNEGGYDIKEVQLWEVSMVTFAMNEESVITEVKSIDPLSLVKKVADGDLRFKLEKEISRLMSKSQETSTEAEVDVAVIETPPEPEVVPYDIIAEVNKLYN